MKPSQALVPGTLSLAVKAVTCTNFLQTLRPAGEGSLQMVFPQNSRLLSNQAVFVSPAYVLCLLLAGSSSGPKDLSPSPVPQVSCAPEEGQK